MSYVSIGMLVGNFLCSFFVAFLASATNGSYTAMFAIVATAATIASAAFFAAAILRGAAARKIAAAHEDDAAYTAVSERTHQTE